jgi:dienelactone hydrolase
VSRGDHVPGRLWLEAGSRPRPLVLVAPALGAGKDASDVAALCREIAAAGMAAAAIDLPLQGERASTKLSARLAVCAAQGARTPMDRLLWDEFLRQTALDLAAAREMLVQRREVEASRSACVAYEPGAAAAAAWAASDAAVAFCVRAPRDAEPAALVAQLRLELAPRGGP